MEWYGRISREVEDGETVIKIVLGNPNKKPSVKRWSIIVDTIDNLFGGYCSIEDVEEIDITEPTLGSIYLNPLFVGKTGNEVERRKVVLVDSSCMYENKAGVLDDSTSTNTSTNIGDSVSETVNSKTPKRASGFIFVNESTVLDKSNPINWTKDEVLMLLKMVIGIPEELCPSNIYGIHFAVIVNTLLCCKGDIESKIDNACKDLVEDVHSLIVRKWIVQWIAFHLIENFM